MIDITSGDAQVLKTRQLMNKRFDIDVTINEETHNLEIEIFYNENLDGSDAELEQIKVGNACFEQGVGLDVGLNLNEALDHWLNQSYELTEAETRTEFDLIFAEVWDYIEEKGLY